MPCVFGFCNESVSIRVVVSSISGRSPRTFLTTQSVSMIFEQNPGSQTYMVVDRLEHLLGRNQ